MSKHPNMKKKEGRGKKASYATNKSKQPIGLNLKIQLHQVQVYKVTFQVDIKQFKNQIYDHNIWVVSTDIHK